MPTEMTIQYVRFETRIMYSLTQAECLQGKAIKVVSIAMCNNKPLIHRYCRMIECRIPDNNFMDSRPFFSKGNSTVYSFLRWAVLDHLDPLAISPIHS